MSNPINKVEQVKASENYVIGVDISSNEDTVVLTVGRIEKGKVTIVNNFIGEEAKWMYERPTKCSGLLY